MRNQDFMQPAIYASVTAGASPTLAASRGIASVTNVATGQHRITLTEAIPVASMIPQATRNAAAHGSISVRTVSDTTLDVYTFDGAAAAANVNFWFTVARIGY